MTTKKLIILLFLGINLKASSDEERLKNILEDNFSLIVQERQLIEISDPKMREEARKVLDERTQSQMSYSYR